MHPLRFLHPGLIEQLHKMTLTVARRFRNHILDINRAVYLVVRLLRILLDGKRPVLPPDSLVLSQMLRVAWDQRETPEPNQRLERPLAPLGTVPGYTLARTHRPCYTLAQLAA